MIKTSREIRQIFLDFFRKKGHTVVPSSSLIPADPTVLFTTAGMQQFIPYLSGEAEPPYQRACSVQKCFRTGDIDQVGDEIHHTFFEMLGNWSFGDYWKKEAIEYALELLDEYGLSKNRLWVTVFKGENNIPRDDEAIDLWIKAGIPKERIKEFGLKDNFWGPITETGPCGPCSEIHYDRGEKFKRAKCTIKGCGPNCGCGRFVEIWNLVFMSYTRISMRMSANDNANKQRYIYKPLSQKNIDTGIGFERLVAILQNKESAYETDLFLPIMECLSRSEADLRSRRIIADHLRAACFLIADGVLPSKEDRGYVLRRILRRAILKLRINLSLSLRGGSGSCRTDQSLPCKAASAKAGNPVVNDRKNNSRLIPESSCEIASSHTFSERSVGLAVTVREVIETYQDIYPELRRAKNDILTVIQKEEERFSKTLNKGLIKLRNITNLRKEDGSMRLSGEEAFHLFDTYGFPLELTKEIAREEGIEVDEQGFKEAFRKHQEISRAGVEKKFGGTGIEKIQDQEDKIKITKLHTATHLLHQALRDVLGKHVKQMGSDINPERLRFDFSHPQKLTEEERIKIEKIVNQKIEEGLPVKMEEMNYEKALESGALAFFKEKYPKTVKVYSIGDYSKEICAGPHVKNTREIGQFKIISEKSSSAGVRRIKAVILQDIPQKKVDS